MRAKQDPTSIILTKLNGTQGTQARIDRRLAISREAQAHILELYAAGAETRSLAERFGVQENYIRKLASRHGIRKGQPTGLQEVATKRPRAPLKNQHVQAYKRVHRGFELPRHLEADYTRLLISGLSRRAAAERLGLLPAQEPAMPR